MKLNYGDFSLFSEISLSSDVLNGVQNIISWVRENVQVKPKISFWISLLEQNPILFNSIQSEKRSYRTPSRDE